MSPSWVLYWSIIACFCSLISISFFTFRVYILAMAQAAAGERPIRLIVRCPCQRHSKHIIPHFFSYVNSFLKKTFIVCIFYTVFILYRGHSHRFLMDMLTKRRCTFEKMTVISIITVTFSVLKFCTVSKYRCPF